jgi:arylsulfatase A-like enzyme
MRLPIAILLLSLVITACRDAATTEPAEKRLRPNVVVIVIDTLRADRLPFYDGERSTAPFLDSLARKSLVFDRAWSASSWTGPATASIFTGLEPNRHGVRLGLRAGMTREGDEDAYELNRIPEEIATLPSFMKSIGYETFGASANPNIGERMGFVRGFDHFAPFTPAQGPGAGPLTQNVLAWKDELRSASPFFLYLHFADPHGPFIRHPEWIESDSPRPKNGLDDIVAYDSEIRHADEHIRRIFEELALGDDTLVIMTSDHGQEFLDHGNRGHGWKLYSELTHVPLFIHLPVEERLHGRIQANVVSADILATLHDLLDAGNESSVPGTSLLEARRDALGDRHAFSMRTRHVAGVGSAHIYSIVAGRFKLIVHDEDGRRELYDLLDDPEEKSDIAASKPEIAAQLAKALASQRAHAAASAHRSSSRYRPSPEMVEMLEVLGYGEDGVNTGGAP